jgi:hypothetical protein
MSKFITNDASIFYVCLALKMDVKNGCKRCVVSLKTSILKKGCSLRFAPLKVTIIYFDTDEAIPNALRVEQLSCHIETKYR